MVRRSSTYWKDYPDTSTNPSAADYNDIEAGLDSVVGSGRTGAPVFRAHLAANAALTAGQTALAAAGWPADVDNAAGYTPGSPSYYTIPITGAYGLALHTLWDAGTAVQYATFYKNGTTAASVLAIRAEGNAMSGYDTSNVHCVDELPLVVGDKIYWAVATSAACNLIAARTLQTTHISIRYVGPV